VLAVILVGHWSLFAAAPASGHAFAPSLLEVRETEPGHALVRWKQPAVRVSGSGLVPVMSESCRTCAEPETSTEDTGVVASWEIDCLGGLVGQTIWVEGIAASQANVLLRLVLADGRSVRHVLTADQPSFVVPEREGALDVMAGYGRLGIEHILTGFDHLLFVLGLVLLVGGGRRLLWTVTAFTLGHSVTLALAILGFVRVPQRPIEAGIAFSIYVLAVELAPRESRKPTLLERAPWLVAGLFGLLHGLGFAGALAQVGLPPGEIPLALFSFNVGIEAGQLVFVGIVLVTWEVLRTLPVRWPPLAIYLPAYAMGTLAAFWFFQRLAASLTGFR
jgi:hydrogenase/urease accessory protein HupE